MLDQYKKGDAPVEQADMPNIASLNSLAKKQPVAPAATVNQAASQKRQSRYNSQNRAPIQPPAAAKVAPKKTGGAKPNAPLGVRR